MTINYSGTIKSLRDIVWGEVANPLSQIEQITLLIFIKLLSERHNELQRLKAKKLVFSGDFAPFHFDSLSRLAGYELVDTTRKAIESLSKNPNIDESIRRIYERSYLEIREPRVLSLLINEINKINITHIDMGDFYEHLLSVLGAQKEMGSFRTPRHLIKFIVDIIDPQIGERVLDPACGTAGFLTAAYIHVRDSNTSKKARKTDSYLDKLNFDQKNFLLNKTIYGYDIDKNMIKFAISNLYLHNIKNPNISQHNTLTSNDSWEEKYDVILTNPPFSTPKGGVKPTDKFTLNSKRTEVLFVEYVMEHLTLNGRAGVIVPEGIIFKSDKTYKELRRWLVENNYLYAIVSLPPGVFNPYANVKTCILFLDRERASKSDKILFCKVDNDGFDLGANRRPIDKNDLPEVLTVVKDYKANPDKSIDSKLGYSIPKDKIIKSGDYNLTGDRYKETIGITNPKWPKVELGEICEIYQPKTITSKEITSSGLYKVFGANGVIGFYDKYNHEDCEVLVTCRGATCGSINLSEPKCWITGNAMVIKPKDKLNKKYLFYLLKNTNLKGTISGSAQPQITKSTLSPFIIPFPPLSIQQQIVDELDSYQKIIDGAKQVIDNYKPQIKINSNWEKVELAKVIKTITPSHKIQKSKYYDQGNYPIIDQSQDKIAGWTNDKKMLVNFPKPVVIFGDHTCVIKYSDILFAQGADGIKILLTNENLIPKFLYYYLLAFPIKTEGYKRHFRKLTETVISIPPLEKQKRMVALIEEEQKLVGYNKKLIQLFEQKIKDKIAEVWGN